MQNLAKIEQNIRIFPGILGVLPIWLILGPTATPASDSAQRTEPRNLTICADHTDLIHRLRQAKEAHA